MKLTVKLSAIISVFWMVCSCSNITDINEYSVYKDSDSNNLNADETAEMAREELEILLNDFNEAFSTKADEERQISDFYTIYEEADSTRATEAKKAVMHVFNFKDNKGYALMSADEEAPTLYAFVGLGHLNYGDGIRNPGFGIFMEYLRLTIDGKEPEEPNIPYKGEYKTYGKWENIFYNKEGLCNVEWSQEEPYNELCPKKDNKNCLTSCTSTAMAQFMSIYKYPLSHNGYDFNWDEMTAYPKANGCSANGKTQIARLYEQLGTKKNLNVKYGLDKSTADIDNVPRTFKNFGYSSKVKIINYNTDKVVNELKSGYSTMVSGYSHKIDHQIFNFTLYSTYSGGHLWVCHGLLERRRNVYTYKNNKCIDTTTESQWYPLCNWGWGGLDNGFFLSGVFDSDNPYEDYLTEEGDTRSGDEDYNYQYKLQAIINIRK